MTRALAALQLPAHRDDASPQEDANPQNHTPRRPADDPFELLRLGTPEPVPHRARMERLFEQDFSAVKSFTGAANVLAPLGAEAAAYGDTIAFAARDPRPAQVAHELTHVVQQRQHGAHALAADRGVSQPGDPAELEAERIAALTDAADLQPVRVRAAPSASIHLQRAGDAGPAPASGGQRLPTEVRARMEALLGVDLSAVRIHVGPDAERVDAIAFARGADLYFAPGQYDPWSERGVALLAHELAHVVQQAAGRAAPRDGAALADDPSLEREADELGARAAHPDATPRAPISLAPLRATGDVVQRKPTVNPVATARLNKLALLGDGTPGNPGLTCGDLETYVARQADWFTDPSLTQPDRDMVWKVLLLLHEGPQFSAALRNLRVAEIAGLAAPDMAKLRAYASCFDTTAQTTQQNAPAATMTRALQLGQAVSDIALFVPAAVMRVVITDAALTFLVDNAKIPELMKYFTDFSPTFESPDEWPHIQTLLNEGVATYAGLKGWVHDLHVFTQPARQKLLLNVADKTRARPVLLILMSGLDWNTAFLQAKNLEGAILDPHNLALVVQGPASIGAATESVNSVADDYGQRQRSLDLGTFPPKWVYGPGRLGQVVIAGHGSEHSVEMATPGTGATATNNNKTVSYNQNQIDSSDPVANGTQALIDAILLRQDPGNANVVFAGCLVGSHDIKTSTNVSNPATAQANLQAALAANPNLADYVRQRMAALGVTGQVQAANASTPFGSFNVDSPTGRAQLSSSVDPKVGGTQLEDVQNGSEPEGALRAALVTYADPAIGPSKTTTAMRTRLASLAGNKGWYETITRLGYQRVLPPAPADVDVAYMLELSHRISWWLFAGWDTMINVQGLANTITAAEAPVVYPEMLASNVGTQDHLAVGARMAWMQLDPAQAGPFMAALTASALTRRKFQSLVARAIVDKQLATLLPVGAPTRGQLVLALTIAVTDGVKKMPADVRNFLRAAAGGATTTSFPAALGVPALLDGASELQILRDIGLAPAAAPPTGAPPPATVDGNVDLDHNKKNETYVEVEPHEATVTAKAARVHRSPSTTSPAITLVKAGDVLRVMGTSDSWSFIDHHGHTGFIQSSHLA